MFISTFIVCIAIFLYNHFTKYNDYWKNRNVPGPKPTFFFGNVKDVALRKKAACDIFSDICAKYPKEKVVGIFRMRTPELLVTDLDIIKNILIKDFELFVERGVAFAEADLGANLFHATTDTWRVLRSRFTPLFTSGKLKNMTYLMTELADKFVDYVVKITREQPEQEMHSLVTKYTQSTISACAFGIDIDSFDDKLSKTLQRINNKIVSNTFSNEFEMMYPGILMKLGLSLFPKEVKTFFSNLTKNVIALRNGEPTSRNDFMDLILAMRNAKLITGPKRGNQSEQTIDVTDEVITAQSFIFFFAGNETGACTLGFVLRQLALHPDIQDKVVNEIQKVIQKYRGELTYQAISELTYMDKVFAETLRLHTVVESIRRCAKIDYKLPGTDVIVKKGQIIIIPVNYIHRDARHFPNPGTFDPERFSPENVTTRHSCAYMPFGLGPRQCIGVRFARVQVKICLAKLLSKFRVEPSSNTPKQIKYVPARFVQMPVGGFPLNLIRKQPAK